MHRLAAERRRRLARTKTRWAATRWAARIGTALTGVATAMLLFAGSASAHVEVSGIDAVQGGYGVVTFRVPSESATASTVELLITFPADTPFVSADLQPKPGWIGKVITKPLPKPMTNDDGDQVTQYVAQVDFKADSPATGIPAGEFDMFNISIGAFPDQPSISFAALQTYSDGTTVNWDEKSANGTEPEHPAPVLELTPASAAQTTATSSPNPPVAATAGSHSSNWPGVVGMIVGIVALLVSIAVLLIVRDRDPAATSST
jgi:uncharacterized protein YcnI